jgi:hypothetical protein
MHGKMMKNKIPEIEKKQWEKLKGESSRQFLAFSQYLELGSRRNLVKIASSCNLTPSSIRKWARKWDWEERASAYDRHLIEIRKQKKREQHEKVENIHSKRMLDMSLVIYKLIDLINKKTGNELNKLSDMELTDLLKAVKLLTNVLPTLSNIASVNMNISKPVWNEDKDPLDFMTLYDKHPELIDDVSDLLGKIIDVETENHNKE